MELAEPNTSKFKILNISLKFLTGVYFVLLASSLYLDAIPQKYFAMTIVWCIGVASIIGNFKDVHKKYSAKIQNIKNEYAFDHFSENNDLLYKLKTALRNEYRFNIIKSFFAVIGSIGMLLLIIIRQINL